MDWKNNSNFFFIEMKNFHYIILIFLCAVNGFAQLNPQSKKITEKFFPDHDKIENVTPALQKNKGFTDYEELTAFLENLNAKHADYVSITYIGESQKGKKIPLIKITNPNSKQEKIRFWMQGGLHGNEPASSEGILYLLHTVLNNPEHKYLFDKIELAVIPMANIDGYLKQDRYAANGLDLNRDQSKLMAPESIILKQAYSDFRAEVAVDFHEYNPFRKDFSKLSTFGIASYYDIMFLYSGNLNVPKNLRSVTDTLFVNNARTVLTANNLSHHDYVSTDEHRGEIQFNQGSSSCRSSATSYALTNAISTLIEIRGVGIGRTSLKRRINTTYLIGLSYLKTAYENSILVKSEIEKAQNFPDEIIVTSTRKVYKDVIKVIDFDTNDMINLEVTIRDALQSEAALARTLPQGYLITADQVELISKLEILGIKVEKIPEDIKYNVESFVIKTYERDKVLYEKMNLQTVKSEIVAKEILFPKGTFMISTAQKNAPLLTELLEPEAPNSFVSFGVLKTELNQELPIYRLPKTELK
jgi:hypothetical protein